MPVETRRSATTAVAATPLSPAPTSASKATETTAGEQQPLAQIAEAGRQEDAEEDGYEYLRTHPGQGVQVPEKSLFDAVRQFATKHDLPLDGLRHEDDQSYFDLRGITPESEDAVLDHVHERLARQEATRQSPSSEDVMNTSSSEDCRKDEELDALRHEIAELEQEIDISKQYKIIDRLGEGTFSSVYKAIDCKHAFYDNEKWLSKRAPLSIKGFLQHSNSSNSNTSISSASSNSSASTSASILSLTGALSRKHKRSSSSSSNSPYAKLMTARKLLKQVTEEDAAEHSKSKVYVALKRIYVTSSPQRIWNELDILGLLRNARNTAYLVSAIRHEDQVIAVMPYEKHQDFRTYYRNMALWQMQAYFKCLFAALADCHDFGIMHRDVKPANFLFNINTNTGTLCDFGLAQRYHPSEWQGRCLHSQPVLWANQFEEIYTLPKSAIVHGEKLSRPIDTLTQLSNQKELYDKLKGECLVEVYGEREGPKNITKVYATDGYSTVFVPAARFEREMKRKIEKDQWDERWMPVRRPLSTMKVGYMKPEFDKRPAIRANRAGTRGFRAPEVILKCPDQTMALDIWSVGVTLLCLLTRRFPFFTSTDDTEALVEIAAIFGKKRMEKCAALHNRSFLTNLPCIDDPTHASLHDLVRSLNPNIFVEAMPSWAREQYTIQQQRDMLTNHKYIAEEMDIKFWYNSECKLYQAVELMRSCLALDLTKRITAADALNHPFLSEN